MKVFNFDAELDRVVDGDTIDVILDLGFKLKKKVRLRIKGIDTPECRTRNKQEKQAGLKVKLWVDVMLSSTEFRVRSETVSGKYGGRVLGDIVFPSQQTLSGRLIQKGYAASCPGGGRWKWKKKDLDYIILN